MAEWLSHSNSDRRVVRSKPAVGEDEEGEDESEEQWSHGRKRRERCVGEEGSQRNK